MKQQHMKIWATNLQVVQYKAIVYETGYIVGILETQFRYWELLSPVKVLKLKGNIYLYVFVNSKLSNKSKCLIIIFL